jgi:hypothetical protein
VNSNIITLQNNSYVTCVSANISSPIFVTPLNTTVNGYISSILETIDWTSDNWISPNERVVGSLIVDKRWEGKHVYISIYIFRIPPPPGGTAILPEYIHYYG